MQSVDYKSLQKRKRRKTLHFVSVTNDSIAEYYCFKHLRIHFVYKSFAEQLMYIIKIPCQTNCIKHIIDYVSDRLKDINYYIFFEILSIKP